MSALLEYTSGRLRCQSSRRCAVRRSHILEMVMFLHTGIHRHLFLAKTRLCLVDKVCLHHDRSYDCIGLCVLRLLCFIFGGVVLPLTMGHGSAHDWHEDNEWRNT